MITGLRVENFKRYEDQSVDLRQRMIVLVGPNSSGKSSLLKPLLAFKQTLEDQTDHAGFLSRGPYVDVGPYSEYVKGHDKRKKARFTFSVAPSTQNVWWEEVPTFRSATLHFTQEEDPQSGQGRMCEYAIRMPESPAETAFLATDRFESNMIRFVRMQSAEERYRIELTPSMLDVMERVYGLFNRQKKFDRQAVVTALSKGRIQATRSSESGMSIDHWHGDVPPIVENRVAGVIG